MVKRIYAYTQCGLEFFFCAVLTQGVYTSWRKVHKDLSAIKVSDLVLTPGINMKAIQHFYDAIRKAFFKSEEYNWRWYKFRNRSEYVTYLLKHEEAE